MSIEWRILGKAGADNALHATVDTGQSRTSLLFDCGEHCLDDLRPTEVQSVAHVCFSHFHMDHVAGFDGFFRLNYNRPDAPVFVWGPEGTIPLMAHRFQGFVWNLHAGQPGEWIVREVAGDRVGSSRFLTCEAFSTDHREPDRPRCTLEIHREDTWHLEAMALPHGSIPSLAYRLVESDRSNIDPAALARLGWKPGPWLKQVVDQGIADNTTVSADAETRSIGELREALLTTTPGESIAWLTDFRAEPGSKIWDRLVSWLSGTTVLVCECQYRSEDHLLAARNAHMTADLVARLASESGVGRLVLQHLSRRYGPETWAEMHREAKSIFPRTELPREWAAAR